MGPVHLSHIFLVYKLKSGSWCFAYWFFNLTELFGVMLIKSGYICWSAAQELHQLVFDACC